MEHTYGRPMIQGVVLFCLSCFFFAFCSFFLIFWFRLFSLSFLPLSPISYLLFKLSLILSTQARYCAGHSFFYDVRQDSSLSFRSFKCNESYLPQQFLYFFPLPHGQSSLRPIFFSAVLVLGGFNNISKSVISSGLSGSNPIVNIQPFSSNFDATSFILSSVCTRTIAGFFLVPNFAFFGPSKSFSISLPLKIFMTLYTA